MNSNSRSRVFVRPRGRVKKCAEEKGLMNHCKRVLVLRTRFLLSENLSSLPSYLLHGDLCTVIPEKLQSEVLEFCHNDWSAGHYGSFKTHKRILLRLFWWPKLFEDVDGYQGMAN